MTFGIIYPDISAFFGVARIFRIEEILVGGFWNLIRYPSAESKSGIHFRLPATETPDNTENLPFFSDYRGFPDPADENGFQIRIIHQKIHVL